MEKLEDDTCQLLISPRGLLPARRVAILFATRAARHVSCQRGQSHMESQRVPWRLPARTCTHGSGPPVTFQRRVNEAKLVTRRNFLLSSKKHFSDILAVSSRQTKLDAPFLTNRILSLIIKNSSQDSLYDEFGSFCDESCSSSMHLFPLVMKSMQGSSPRTQIGRRRA